MDYPTLKHLFGSYYHEDFDGLFEPTIEFLGDEPAEIPQLVNELNQLLARQLSHDELDTILEELGSYAYLRESDMSYTDWLRQIRELASIALHPQS